MTTVTLFILACMLAITSLSMLSVARAIREIAAELRKARRGEKP